MFGLGGLFGSVSGGLSPSASSSSGLNTGPVDTTQASDFIFNGGGGGASAVNPALVAAGVAAAVVLLVLVARR